MLKTLIIFGVAVTGIVAVAVIYGAYRWADGTSDLRAGLEAARRPVTPRVVDFQELEVLPAPVQRYFRIAIKQGKPMVAGVNVKHNGTFNMRETAEQWKPFSSDQKVVTRRPGFAWDGRITMLPGLAVRVRDAYVAGKGTLHAALLGLITVADMRGTHDVAKGELMRFLAEAAWYPTALLPSQGVRWEAVDTHSARATLTDSIISLTVLFSFNEQGLIETVRADARGRTIGDRIVPTPWQGRFWNYQDREGMYVPLDGEAAWLLPDGPRPYWRGRITAISYEFAT